MAPYPIEIFYDGECPLCAREMNWLRRRDKRGRLRFTDISGLEFSAAEVGVPSGELMAAIHARLPDGSVIKGVEVFRRVYAAVGFAPLVALTRLPGVSHVLDRLYRWFARNRLRLTGRCGDGACAVRAGTGRT